MRSMTLLLCVALAGCAGANAAHDVVPASAAMASSAPEPAGPKGRFGYAKQGDAAKEDWWKEGGVTREKISAMCWMKYERGRADMAIDKRADLVDQCVAQALKDHPVR